MSENQKKFNQATGITHIWRALFYSWDGLKAAFQHEEAFRLEVVLACVMIPIAFFFPVSVSLRALMMGSVMLVLIIELLNSAIEAVVDRISLDHHPLSKRAKDLGSAAVLLSLINVAGIWLLGLWDWMHQLISQ